MGCGSSNHVVEVLPERSESTSNLINKEALNNEQGIFSRPGSSPVSGLKNKSRKESGASVAPLMTGEGDVIEKTKSNWCDDDDSARKASAISKMSMDSGISIGNPGKTNPTLPPISSFGDQNSEETRKQIVPRLASTEILSQLNDMGIVPLRTNRCGSSLAFNIELAAIKTPDTPTNVPAGTTRQLPPLPPPRLMRLESLPPLQTSIEDLEEKQKKAEERRKKAWYSTSRREKARLKAERVSERRISEVDKEEEERERVNQLILEKALSSEANKEKIRQKQLEKKLRNEERLLRAKQNREKLLQNGGANSLDNSFNGDIEGDVSRSNEFDDEGLATLKADTAQDFFPDTNEDTDTRACSEESTNV